jgi:hypothetical protein
MNNHHQPGLPPVVADACRRVRVDARIIGLMSEVASERALTAEADTTSYVGVRPPAGQVAVYLNPDNLDFRLDPDRARQISRQREWLITRANATTGTLRVLASQLGDATAEVRQLVHEALDRSEAGPDFRNEPRSGRAAEQTFETCPRHPGVVMLGGTCNFCE